MNKGSDQSPPKAEVSAVEPSKFDGRRQLIKAALVAAPMILTLRGRPALADLPSLGSVEVPYGPELYVTQADVTASQNSGGTLTSADLHKSIIPNKSAPGQFHIVQQDRRNLAPIKSFSRP